MDKRLHGGGGAPRLARRCDADSATLLAMGCLIVTIVMVVPRMTVVMIVMVIIRNVVGVNRGQSK